MDLEEISLTSAKLQLIYFAKDNRKSVLESTFVSVKEEDLQQLLDLVDKFDETLMAFVPD